MVKSNKCFRKINSEEILEAFQVGNLEKEIDNSLNSGELFSLDEVADVKRSDSKKILENKSNLKLKFKTRVSKNVVSLNKKTIIGETKVIRKSKQDLDIWGDSIKASENKLIKIYPGELFRNKCKSAFLPHPGQSVNPSDTDLKEAIFQSSSLSIKDHSNNVNKNGLSIIDSYISSYYDSSDLLELSETQKYCLFNSIINGNLNDINLVRKLDTSVFNEEICGVDELEFKKKFKRKRKSEINRKERRKQMLLFNEKKMLLKKLNKDVDNIGK